MGFIGLGVLVGTVGGVFAAPAVRTWYPGLTRPPGAPPPWVFGPVWIALYVMMGVAAWLGWRRPGHRRALLLWGWQLLANALWAPLFFGLHLIGGGLVDLVVLLVLLGRTILALHRIARPAALLMLPYFAWVCYAAYVNAGFWWLNQP